MARSFILPGLFFLSGAAALTFEVVWQRMMMLVLGASAPAISAILTSFFLGLAIGSWWGGRLITRWLRAGRHPLVFYGLVELFIGASGLVFPLTLSLANSFYLSWIGAETDVVGISSMVSRFLLAVMVALPGTIGMGATIPAMVTLLNQRGSTVETSISFAYGINTLGSVVGACATGFLFLPQLGVAATTWAAASMNLLVCGGAIALARGADEQRSVPPAAPSAPHPRARALIVVYTITSFLGVGLEVVWFRMLAIFNTNSLVTFTTGLSSYLAGFAIGSLWLFPRLQQRRNGFEILRYSMLSAGIVTMLGGIFGQYVANLVRWSGTVLFGLASYEWALWLEVVNAALLMGPASIMMGMMFPAVCAALQISSDEIGSDSGRIYSIGNLGAMLGAALTALVILPAWGIGVAVIGYGALYVLLASYLVADLPVRTRRWIQVGATATVVLAFWGASSLAPYVAIGRLVAADDHWRYDSPDGWPHIISDEVGESASIYVKEWEDGGRRIYVDDQGVAGTFLSAAVDAKMLAHIPLFLHPAPRSALTVGFGSGGTSWSMVTHGVDTDVAEIEPAVVRAAPFFESRNHGVRENPKLRVIINDARNHLHATTRRYDVISTDSTNLQYKQNSSLYTVEYFELMRDRLNPGGIACVWIPLAGISDEELATLMRSFQEVFAEASLWFMDHTWTRFGILVGAEEPIRVDPAVLYERFERPAVKRDLAEIGVTDPLHILHFLYLDPDGYREFTGPGPLHTDDHPLLEFGSFASAHGSGGASLNERIQRFRELRPEGIDGLLSTISDTTRARIERVGAFAALMREYVYQVVFSGKDTSRRAMIALLSRALELDPDNEIARSERAKLRRADDLRRRR